MKIANGELINLIFYSIPKGHSVAQMVADTFLDKKTVIKVLKRVRNFIKQELENQ